VSDQIKVRSIVLDCPDAGALARFYADITGWELIQEDDEWATLRGPDSVRICFQKVEGDRAPTWPDGPVPQQFHLDLSVDEFEASEKRVIAAGATKFEHQPGDDFRVFADPAGHPFCLCL
jgi:hypothetical protein